MTICTSRTRERVASPTWFCRARSRLWRGDGESSRHQGHRPDQAFGVRDRQIEYFAFLNPRCNARRLLPARVQTVHKETNPRYHALIARFKERTGCPVLVNTSFNMRGEPIVCTPEDAFRCFMGTEIETLAMGNCFLRRGKQNPALRQNYESKFELD